MEDYGLTIAEIMDLIIIKDHRSHVYGLIGTFVIKEKMDMNEKFIERIDAVFLPVKNLEESLTWYTSIFGFPVRWKNNRMAGLSIAPNCGFHLVEVKDYVAQKGYTPFNFVVKDIVAVRDRLKSMKVKVSEINTNEPVRFDFIDINSNAISVIQLD